jgi:putative CocE/NonD family hydrolase
MVATAPSAPAAHRRLPWVSRMISRPGKGMPAPRCEAGYRPALRIPTTDGAVLLADHYLPLTDAACPTLLVRSPYGRGFPWGGLFGVQFARQGFHVVIVSCRGTAGSGGTRRMFHHEVEDGRDVVAWLREQPWFDGRLGTIGPSYLGFTQLALAANPVPEWRAAVLMAPAAEPAGAHWRGGVFELESALATGIAEPWGQGQGPYLRALARLAVRTRAVYRNLPLVDAYPVAYGRRVPEFEDFLTHPDPSDPLFEGTDMLGHSTRLPATLLVGGWWDLLLGQTLEVHRRRVAAGEPTWLLVGPWTHTSMVDAAGWADVFTASLAFLRSRLDGGPDAGADADQPVRVHVGGGSGWRDLPAWPPAGVRARSWALTPGGGLSPDAVAGPPSVIRYDPADPTPSRGGATLGRPGGVVDNRRIEARPDVLVFSSTPLVDPVEVIGPVSAEVQVRVRGAGADLFVRLCDVAPDGASRNVTDGILRLDGDAAVCGPDGGPVTVALDPTAHRFAPGHRIRVQVAGAAFPRFMRNLGTGELIATGTRTAPVTIELLHRPDAASAVLLPVVPT